MGMAARDRVMDGADRRSDLAANDPAPDDADTARPPAVTAIVLAAGASRRMGRPKALLPWGATTVLGQTLANLARSQVREVVVVTGDQAAAVGRIATAHGARSVHNPAWSSQGMVASLQAGIRAVGPDCPAALVLLADQPMIGPEIIDAVLAACPADGWVIAAAAFRGRRGHPVLFGRACFDALLALPGDAAPRALVARHPAAVKLVEVASDVVLRDLDTPEDYERWRP